MPRSTLFRSEEMSLIQLLIPTEVAHSTVSYMGEKGLIQFCDLNPNLSSFQRPFMDEIRRLRDVEQQIQSFNRQCVSFNIRVASLSEGEHGAKFPITTRDIDDLKELLNNHESRLSNLNQSYCTLSQQYQGLVEHRHVLECSADLQEVHSSPFSSSHEESLDPSSVDIENGRSGHSLDVTTGFIAGTIPSVRVNSLETVLWRTLRGNLYMYQNEIANGSTAWDNKPLRKSVFVIYAHGKEILDKIIRITEAMGATLYPIDSCPIQRRIRISGIDRSLSDLRAVLESTYQTKHTELEGISRKLPHWMSLIMKEKIIYHVMNLFIYDHSRKCLVAEGWCPSTDILLIQRSAREAVESTGSHIYTIIIPLQTSRQPPTFHRTNRFSAGFQSIVDTYGVAKYREVNPGLFTVITFPFLFAIMFGDMGHGLLVTAFSLWLILRESTHEKTKKSEIFSIIFSGRYVILMMGLFSIFTGLIYNDFFSHSLTVVPSGWVWPAASSSDQPREATSIGVCLFGLDSAWHGTDNYMLFTNSYKMKMSIILGVLQMSFGIILAIYNHTQFQHTYAIVAESLPQILFMGCIFGYLCTCIIYKWLVDWTGQPISPPSLLNMLIHMFLSPGSVSSSDQLYPSQEKVQLVLIIIATLCIPWMLLAKPFVLKFKSSRKVKELPVQMSVKKQNLKDTKIMYARIPCNLMNQKQRSKMKKESSPGSVEVTTEEIDTEHVVEFGELMISQMIHTIEFCLGCISNTASYLRLWALSLAHAQLSSVLWDMTLKVAFSLTFPTSIIGIWAGFAVWFLLTVSILIVMEGLSAFLHALRLHWVEFNSKFYEGSGYKYTPFDFKSIHSEEQLK